MTLPVNIRTDTKTIDFFAVLTASVSATNDLQQEAWSHPYNLSNITEQDIQLNKQLYNQIQHEYAETPRMIKNNDELENVETIQDLFRSITDHPQHDALQEEYKNLQEQIEAIPTCIITLEKIQDPIQLGKQIQSYATMQHFWKNQRCAYYCEEQQRICPPHETRYAHQAKLDYESVITQKTELESKLQVLQPSNITRLPTRRA